MSAYHSPSRSRQTPEAERIRTELPPGLGGNAGEGPKGWRRLSRRERRQLLRGRQVLSRRELAGMVKGSLLEMIQQAGLVWIHDRLEAEADEVCGAPKGKALLEDLTGRGLSAERGLLVVIDGSKALAVAVRAVWGRRAVIQRCIVHSVSRSMEAVGLGKEGRPAA